jgi:hypothetical protein
VKSLASIVFAIAKRYSRLDLISFKEKSCLLDTAEEDEAQGDLSGV